MNHHKSLLFFFLIFSLIFVEGFHVDLIHKYHSPISPFYNFSLNHSDSFIDVSYRSRKRYEKVSSSSTFQSMVVNDIYSDYVAEIYVGTPPIKIHAILDTGSDLVWTQCSPCNDCYLQTDKIYNPRMSSTYDDIPCDSDACSMLSDTNCQNQKCIYNYSYTDHSYSHGSLSRETFIFQSTKGQGKVLLQNLIFGCSVERKGYSLYASGLIGLGGGPLSLVTQLGSRFSYCLPPSSKNSSGFLFFGGVFSGSRIVSDMSSCFSGSTFYCLSLEKVIIEHDFSVAKQIPIIVDSGTTLTFLPDDLLLPIISYLKQVVKLPLLDIYKTTFDICFDASSSNYLFSDLPNLSFVFSGGPIFLPSSNCFMEMKTLEGGMVVCLAIASSSRRIDGSSVFGNLAQQNYLIGYDVKERLMYFEQTDCGRPSSSVHWTLHGTGARLASHMVFVLELFLLVMLIIL